MAEKKKVSTSGIVELRLRTEHKNLVSKDFQALAQFHEAKAKVQEAKAKLANIRADLARAGFVRGGGIMNW